MNETKSGPQEKSAGPDDSTTEILVGKAILLKAAEVLKRTVPEADLAPAPDESGYALNIAGVYQDSVTRDWAMQSCQLATELIGAEHVNNTWYNVNSLCDSGVFLDAVRAALMADVIVVSIYAADKLPLDLCVWIETWLFRRESRAGALAVLVGAGEPLDSQSVLTRDYLESVARKGQLDLILYERKRPVASPVSSIKLIADRASATKKLLHKPQRHRHEIPSHWGLNE